MFGLWCTCKSCSSLISLVLSMESRRLSGLESDSLLSKQETKLDRSFSYLQDSNKEDTLIYYCNNIVLSTIKLNVISALNPSLAAGLLPSALVKGTGRSINLT